MNIVYFKRKKYFVFFIFVIFIGFFFRFYQLNFENYWLDEMVSFWSADPQISFSETLKRSKYIDQSPVLFNLLLKYYFKLFGYNPELGRHLALFFGFLALPFLGILSYQIKKDNSFLLTVFLAAINIYLIKYSQETRTYSLVFLLCIINLIYFYKLLLIKNENIKIIFFNINKTFYIFFAFIFFSFLSLSSHPFVFIILFSQFFYCIYSLIIFKNKNNLFFLSLPIIIFLYLIFNYEYILDQISYKTNYLSQVELSFFYNYFFSRFFGSKIMGSIYLFTILFLVMYFKKNIFLKFNFYLPLIFILLFSYIIPLSYGFLRVPVLNDRYIIFVLISILILISTLIFELPNKKIKFFFLIFILFPTLINHFIEIKFRVNSKPEFAAILNLLKKNETKDLVLIKSRDREQKLVKNYIVHMKEFTNNDFKMNHMSNIQSNLNFVWIICYEPLVGFNCNLKEKDKKNFTLIDKKQKHLVSAKLYKIKK